MPNGYAVNTRDASIANGATASSEIDMQGLAPVALRLPAAFTGTSVSFKNALASGATPNAVYRSDGTLLTITVAQGTDVVLNPLDFLWARYLTIVSGSAEGGARTVTLIARDM